MTKHVGEHEDRTPQTQEASAPSQDRRGMRIKTRIRSGGNNGKGGAYFG